MTLISSHTAEQRTDTSESQEKNENLKTVSFEQSNPSILQRSTLHTAIQTYLYTIRIELLQKAGNSTLTLKKIQV